VCRLCSICGPCGSTGIGIALGRFIGNSDINGSMTGPAPVPEQAISQLLERTA